MKRTEKKFDWEVGIFQSNHNLLRTAQAIAKGIHPRDLYRMQTLGLVTRLSRGLYQLKGKRSLSSPDLVTAALKVPQGIICLISALAFHRITTQIPHEVYMALRKGAEQPRLAFPPARFVRFASAVFESGVETHAIDGVKIRVYSPERTVADCFKFRNKIGLDVAIEALKFCRQRKRSSVEELMKFARLDRVERIMKPYLEAIL